MLCKSVLRTLLPLAAAGSLFISQGSVAKSVTITFFHQWGPAWIGSTFETVAKEFTKRNPEIKVKVVTGADINKLVTAMAGGVSPDVFVSDERISSMVLRNLLTPLDDFIKKERIKPDDFWAPSWRECEWEGKIWAIPWGSDPNFGMWYNKTLFKEIGLPDRVPETIQELNLFSDKALRKVNGKVNRIGISPWSVYGLSNSIYTWGWVFGGSFYNAKDKKVTADDPKVVKALEWMTWYGNRYGGPAVVGSMADFVNGKCVMAPYGPWELANLLPQIKKKNYEIGIGRMPVDSGVTTDPTWVGGHKFVIPMGAKHRNEAMKFIKFIAADQAGTALLAGPINWFPGYKGSEIYSTYRKGQFTAPYVKILEKAAHQRPVMPAAQKY